MAASVPIGEFSRLTHLSVKTLHHYHDAGLLVPDRIDPVADTVATRPRRSARQR
ncbi:MAG: MerR family DNA-binding transcriptional regulator [Mycobacteriales bacterium]